MTVADFVILILLILGTYKGYKDGLLVTVITFLAFIIGILAGFKLMHTAIVYLEAHISNTQILPFIAFLVVFALVFVGIILLGKFLKSALDYTFLGRFDSLGGGAFGLFRTAFMISLLFWLIDVIRVDFFFGLFKDSILYSKMVTLAPTIVDWVSTVIPFQDFFKTLKDTFENR
jgi:membrane protein required for colicin V production